MTGRRAALLAGLALVGLLGVAPAARASCGDYVVSGASAPQPAGHAAPASPHLPPARHDHRTPCHGPNCSGNHGPAPLAPVSASSPISDPCAWLAAGVMPVGGSAGTCDGPSFPRPVRRPYRIERPPRLLSSLPSV